MYIHMYLGMYSVFVEYILGPCARYEQAHEESRFTTSGHLACRQMRRVTSGKQGSLWENVHAVLRDPVRASASREASDLGRDCAVVPSTQALCR